MNKCGGSNKACSWDNFFEKNKKNSMHIKDFKVGVIGSIPSIRVLRINQSNQELCKLWKFGWNKLFLRSFFYSCHSKNCSKITKKTCRPPKKSSLPHCGGSHHWVTVYRILNWRTSIISGFNDSKWLRMTQDAYWYGLNDSLWL